MTKHIFSAVVLAVPFVSLAFLSGCDPNPPPIDQDAGQDAGQDASVDLDGDVPDPTSSSPIVIGGTFNRGADPASPAIVDNFRLDKYEITVGRFRSFVVAWDGGWRPQAGSGKHSHLNDGRGVVGAENRTYPWGASEPDSTRAIFLDGMPGPVGGTPDGNGKWGHADLAGNVWEWTLDWNKSAYSVPCTNCGELTPDLYRNLRGGSWLEDGRLLSTTFRNFEAPAIRDARNGGRCARPAH